MLIQASNSAENLRFLPVDVLLQVRDSETPIKFMVSLLWPAGSLTAQVKSFIDTTIFYTEQGILPYFAMVSNSLYELSN